MTQINWPYWPLAWFLCMDFFKASSPHVTSQSSLPLNPLTLSDSSVHRCLKYFLIPLQSLPVKSCANILSLSPLLVSCTRSLTWFHFLRYTDICHRHFATSPNKGGLWSSEVQKLHTKTPQQHMKKCCLYSEKSTEHTVNTEFTLYQTDRRQCVLFIL